MSVKLTYLKCPVTTGSEVMGIEDEQAIQDIVSLYQNLVEKELMKGGIVLEIISMADLQAKNKSTKSVELKNVFNSNAGGLIFIVPDEKNNSINRIPFVIV